MKRIIFEEPCKWNDNVAEVIVVERRNPSYYGCERVKHYVRPFSIPEDMAEKIRSSKKKLRNSNDGSFAVLVDEPNVYLENLVKEAQNRGLTVSGDGTADVKGGDITTVDYGKIITFGTSSRFDVNWITRQQYACERSIIPIHLLSDWDTVMKALKAFAKEKRELKRSVYYYGNNPTFKDLRARSRERRFDSYANSYNCRRKVVEVEDCRGITARLHDDFIKVGFDFIPVEKVEMKKRREILVMV